MLKFMKIFIIQQLGLTFLLNHVIVTVCSDQFAKYN